MNGIDVSHHQGHIDWITVRRSGISFAFVKATEGLTSTDPLFAANWQAARQVGVARGAYHFFRPQLDPEQQAKHFLEVLGNDLGELPPVLDVEVLDGLTPEDVISRTKKCVNVITTSLGSLPILYTGTSFWRDTLKNPPAFADHPLWIAHYTAGLSPTVPKAWTNWTFWQHSQTGHVPGINGPVDLNRSNSGVLSLS
jgi:lysozyme